MKISLTDKPMEIIIKMSDGNPGVAAAIMDIVENHQGIDPQSALGWLGPVMDFDAMGIYGTDIYVLYSDKCNKDVRQLIMLMRARQLGFIGESKIVEMAKDQCYKINLTEEEFMELDKKVCDKLEDFMKNTNNKPLDHKA